MGFERVDSQYIHDSDEFLRVSADRPGDYLSAGAVREYFEDVDRVEFHVDRDRSLLAIVPHNGDGGSAYKLSGKDDAGAQIHPKQAFRELGIRKDDLESSHSCEVSEDDESGFVVADLSAVVEDATDDTHCPECGKRFAENGLQTHISRQHETDPQDVLEEMDPDEIGEPIPDGDDSWKESQARTDGGSQ